jgi:hypothetical protein
MNENKFEQQLQFEQNDLDIDLKIANETNRDINEITEEVGVLPHLLHSIQNLIWDQGLDINSIQGHVEQSKELTNKGVSNLESAEIHSNKSKKMRDASIMLGGATIGGIGWLGGPWLGIPTTALGLGISSGVVFAIRKMGV